MLLNEIDNLTIKYLGGLLNNKNLLINNPIETRYLSPEVKKVYESCKELSTQDRSITVDSLSYMTQFKGDIQENYLRDIINEVIVSNTPKKEAEDLATIINMMSRQQAVNKFVEYTNKVNDSKDEPATKITKISSAIEKITKLVDPNKVMSISEAIASISGSVERMRELSKKIITTGFVNLDSLNGGFKPGQMIVVAGRPGMGKTAFVQSIAIHASQYSRKSVLFFSLEMPMEDLVCRYLAGETGIYLNDVMSGNLNDYEVHQINVKSKNLKDINWFIDDSSDMTVAKIKQRAQVIKATKGLDMIVIDYLQLVKDPTCKNRFEEVSKVSREIKALAKDLGVPVIALSQLSRAVESRIDNKPTLSDLRESGQIEQDADMVIFVHREYYYTKQDKHRGTAELLVAKNRHGATAVVHVDFDERKIQFLNPKEYIPNDGPRTSPYKPEPSDFTHIKTVAVEHNPFE